MANSHTKFVEVNEQDHTIRIVEKDRRGRIFGKSEFLQFNSSVDTMKLALTMQGYKFHHGTELIHVFEEVV